MQNWSRIYDYIHEYQHLVYEYYSNSAVAFLTTYWNINRDETVWDDEKLFGGAYEVLGDLTGMKWNKYLLLPVYFIDEINTSFDGSETGLNKDQTTTIVIPSSYGITPFPNDIVKLEQQYMRPNNNTYPIFSVTGREIHPNTDKRFWKLRLKVEQSMTTTDVENQTQDTFVFFDYDKQVHTLDEATTLATLMSKNEELRNRLKNMWDENTGFYHI